MRISHTTQSVSSARRPTWHALVVAVSLLITGLVSVPQPAAADELPLLCALAGRGISTFAKINIAEFQTFQAARTDFRVRIIRYDPGALDPNLPTAAQAFAQCADGSDGYGPADVIVEVIGFVRPAWLSVASAHPDAQFVIIRAPSPLSGAPANTHFYVPQEYRSWFVKGVIAARKSASGHLGMLTAVYNNPEVTQNINAFLLGAKSVRPDAVINVVSTETYNETAPALPQPPGPLEQWNCQNPASAFPSGTGVPLDCLAIDKLVAHDPQIDFIAHMKSNVLVQAYVLNVLTPDQPNDYGFVENQVSRTMTAEDQAAVLADPRVLTATNFDFQPILNQMADQYLSGELQQRPASLDYVQRVDGHRTVDITELSSLITGRERIAIKRVARKALNERPRNDPFCGTLAAQYLGGVYTLVDGCVSETDQVRGTALSPEIASEDRLVCIAETNPDPNGYPLRCKP